MKVRRKSLWRSQNNKLAIKRRNQRAAKERQRQERAARVDPLPDCSHVARPARPKPLFVVTIRCRDGECERIKIFENPWNGLSPSPSSVARKLAVVLAQYRPASYGL